VSAPGQPPPSTPPPPPDPGRGNETKRVEAPARPAAQATSKLTEDDIAEYRRIAAEAQAKLAAKGEAPKFPGLPPPEAPKAAPAPAAAAPAKAAPAPAAPAAAPPAAATATPAPVEDDDDDPVFLPEGAMELDGVELVEYQLFSDIAAKDIDSLINRHKINKRQPPVWLRSFKRGDVICREGEYGSTAFFIAKGRVEVRIAPPRGKELSPKDVRNKKSGFFAKVGNAFFGGASQTSKGPVAAPVGAAKDKPAFDPRKTRMIPIDASVSLPYDRPFGELKEGDLFGEQTCLSSYPRAATCVALEDVECIELLRSAFELCRTKSKRFKVEVEKSYRERAFEGQLRAVPLFAELTKDFIDYLRPRVEFVEAKPGTVICKEGDPADAFFIVRVGFVKVTQKRPGGDMVLRYLGPSNYFGEVGLLLNTPRRATCTAIEHCELVKIKREDFDLMMARFPEVAGRMRAQANALLSKPKSIAEAPMVAARLDEYLTQGLMTAQNVLLIDLDKCTRCDECVHACAEAHDGVSRLLRDGLRFDKYLVATSCRACQDPVCMIGCPVSSIRRRDSLEIVIEDWCIGCGKCADNCPYGNISMHPYTEEVEDAEKPGKKKEEVVNKGKGKAVTCDLSADLPEPACVYACPHSAAMRVKPSEFFASKLVGAGETAQVGKRTQFFTVKKFD